MIQVQNHNQCKTLISISYEILPISLVREVNTLTLHWLHGYEICLESAILKKTKLGVIQL